MNIEDLEKLLEENSAKDENDDREIIKFKTNIKLEKMDMLRVKVFDISNYL